MKQTPELKRKTPRIEAVLSETLSQNFSRLSGETQRVQVENIGFKDFQSEAEKIQTGRILYIYTDTDSAVMSIFLPEDAKKIFYRKFSDLDSGENDNVALTKLLNRIAGSLPLLCSIKKNDKESNIFNLQKPYTSELKDQLLWDASECNIFRCSVIGAIFYLPLNIELQKIIEGFLKTDLSYTKILKQKLSPPKVPQAGVFALHDSDIRVRVKNPLEFIIGSSFLPREAYLGKKDVSVVFNEIISAKDPASYMNDGMIWYRFWIISGGTEYSVYYSVDVKGETKKYVQFFNSLFTELVKKTAAYLRSQSGFEQVKGKIVSPPEGLEDIIILTANINWENKRIMTRVFVPELFLSSYLSPFLEPWEVESLTKSDTCVLLFLLSINSTIFGKNIETFYRQTGVDPSGGEVPQIGVSNILAILDTYNASRLVQNYFLAGGSSLDEFQSLFLYRYSIDGEEKAKIGRDALFNKEEYKKFIPKALHSDWELCSGLSDSYKELASLNQKALKGIYAAIQADKLLMPYKVFFILYNEFQKPLDKRFKDEIRRLVEENRWQSLIEIIPKKTGQQVISATPTSKLGMALIPGKPEVKELAHLMSKKKRSELEEELRINTKKYESGFLSAEMVFLAMKELLDILDLLANPDEEML